MSKRQNLDKAIADYTQAIKLAPQAAAAFRSRGILWRRVKAYDKAIADFSEAVRLNPRDPIVRVNRSNVSRDQGAYDKAIADLDEAIRLNPRSHLALANRAHIWAASADPKFRDAKKAIESATKACELSQWKHAYSLSILAMAHAAGGDFATALKWLTKASEINNDPATMKYHRRLRNEFEANKPYFDRVHEPSAQGAENPEDVSPAQ